MELETFDEAFARPCLSLEAVSDSVEEVLRSASFLDYEKYVKDITRNYLRRILPADESGNFDKFEALKIVLAAFQYGKTKEYANNVYAIFIVLLLICFLQKCVMLLASYSISYRCAAPACSQSSIDKGELRHFLQPDSSAYGMPAFSLLRCSRVSGAVGRKTAEAVIF